MLAFRGPSAAQASACLGKPLDETQAERTEPLAALRSLFMAATAREQKKQILDCVCAWSTPEAVPVLQPRIVRCSI